MWNKRNDEKKQQKNKRFEENVWNDGARKHHWKLPQRNVRRRETLTYARTLHTLCLTQKRRNKNTRKAPKGGRTLPAAPPEQTRASPRTRLNKIIDSFPFQKGYVHTGELWHRWSLPRSTNRSPGHSVGFTTGKEQGNPQTRHCTQCALYVLFAPHPAHWMTFSASRAECGQRAADR